MFDAIRINWLLPITKLKKDFLAGKEDSEEIEELGAGALHLMPLMEMLTMDLSWQVKLLDLSKEETCAEI